MNLREKQIVRLLVQEAVKNNPRYVDYYLSQLQQQNRQTHATMALKKVIDQVNRQCPLHMSVNTLTDIGEEGIVKKMFCQAMNQANRFNEIAS
ncbi:hypothetical protein [Vibrio parahaemolyticus]|uniref:hypothetical protein n=1 Tax=Vibrio parahaemolyticus TaxID=670 RepID=UPI00111E3B69|nr:hypothetical protein [Vibrio parahaemolyticus]EGQ7870739.1 hypothetical protein [Vibrio parahaemolyticus]EHE7897014.1 hypothetical protein [Vibrio parahaemolyticus]EHR5464709.1 hypothetical protein [Vibrio parahaemolyticus]EJE4226834.1 hypothetical protein [Vibrio parahaemolyticus]EJG1581277.1 hypothetical protein [Vibrio parahaemolyticus]